MEGASRPAPKRAAPSATVAFGSRWISSGLANRSEISCAASGIRDEPPTIRIAATSDSSTPAYSMASARHVTVLASASRIMPSNSPRVRRTLVRPAGSTTGMLAAVSADSVSFASTHASRIRPMAASRSESDGSGAGSRTPTRR